MRQRQSKEYMAAYMRERYRRDIEWVRQYKIEHGCADCGYKAHHAGLEFDHRDPRATHGGSPVAKIMGKGIGRIKAEIEKCDVVCGACHGIRTWNRRQQTPIT